MNTPKNQYALILGGSSGLGLATAKKLATAGYNICIVHRDRRRSLDAFDKEVAAIKLQGVDVKTFNKDALKKETIQEVLEQVPPSSVKILVHSIAKGSLHPLLSANRSLSKEDLDITIHAMATSWWQWTQALISAHKISLGMRNIAFTSEGNTKVWNGYAAVSAAKAILEALMRQMAVELAPLGITSNCIQAGATQTPSFDMIPGSEKMVAGTTKRNPFQRMTMAADVANAVWLLCQEEAKWINGVVLPVDGGERLR